MVWGTYRNELMHPAEEEIGPLDEVRWAARLGSDVSLCVCNHVYYVFHPTGFFILPPTPMGMFACFARRWLDSRTLIIEPIELIAACAAQVHCQG